jgi:hypothetical protein
VRCSARVLQWIVTCFFVFCPIYSFADHPSQQPIDMVKRYLQLSAEGAHLTSEGRLKLAKAGNTIPDGEESTITTHVIASFRILSASVEHNTARVSVKFQDIGTLSNDFYDFQPTKQCSNFDFLLEKTANGRWHIVRGPAPTMYASTVLRHLQEIERHASEVGGNPEHYRHLVAEIEATAKTSKESK